MAETNKKMDGALAKPSRMRGSQMKKAGEAARTNVEDFSPPGGLRRKDALGMADNRKKSSVK